MLLLSLQNTQQFKQRAATIALINMVPLFIGGQTNPLANTLGISVQSYYFTHNWIGQVAIVEAVLHSIVMLSLQPQPGSIATSNIIVCSTCQHPPLMLARHLANEFKGTVHYSNYDRCYYLDSLALHRKLFPNFPCCFCISYLSWNHIAYVLIVFAPCKSSSFGFFSNLAVNYTYLSTTHLFTQITYPSKKNHYIPRCYNYRYHNKIRLPGLSGCLLLRYPS